MLGKFLFAISPVIFFLIGAIAGHNVGYSQARTTYENYSLSHDSSLREMGICRWSEAVSQRLNCALEAQNGK